MHATSTIDQQLLQLFLFMGSQWILYVLLFLSVISLAIAAERFFFLWRHSDDLIALQSSLDTCLTANDIDAARQLLKDSPSVVASIALRGIEALDTGAESMEELMAARAQQTKLSMEKGLAFLGTLGNNAPFIGLFGTVLGIIRAFQDLSNNTIEGSSAVMAGLAEALIATAVGLLVALPAVAIYNTFQRTIKRRLSASMGLRHLLLAHVKSTANKENS